MRVVGYFGFVEVVPAVYFMCSLIVFSNSDLSFSRYSTQGRVRGINSEKKMTYYSLVPNSDGSRCAGFSGTAAVAGTVPVDMVVERTFVT